MLKIQKKHTDVISSEYAKKRTVSLDMVTPFVDEFAKLRAKYDNAATFKDPKESMAQVKWGSNLPHPPFILSLTILAVSFPRRNWRTMTQQNYLERR